MLNKRIALSEGTWETLGEMKKAGQTYDELLREIILAANRHDLAERARLALEGEGEWVDL